MRVVRPMSGILKKDSIKQTSTMPSLLILYNTKTGNTELMAKAVEEGAKEVPNVEVSLKYHATPEELQKADAFIIGVPTYNHQMPLDVQSLLEKTAQKRASLEGKTTAAFGSYGWSGEAPKQVLEILRNKFKTKTIEPPILANYKPDEKTLEKCRELGKHVAETLV
jgi:flavorubredoxin